MALGLEVRAWYPQNYRLEPSLPSIMTRYYTFQSKSIGKFKLIYYLLSKNILHDHYHASLQATPLHHCSYYSCPCENAFWYVFQSPFLYLRLLKHNHRPDYVARKTIIVIPLPSTSWGVWTFAVHCQLHVLVILVFCESNYEEDTTTWYPFRHTKPTTLSVQLSSSESHIREVSLMSSIDVFRDY